MSEQIVPRLRGWKDSAIFRKTLEFLGQTINEKSIIVDALSRYALQILHRSNEEPTEAESPQTFKRGDSHLLNPYLFLPPLRKRISSDCKTLHPLPALVALMRPIRMYLKKVGFVILRY
jgi:hypothetical protein